MLNAANETAVHAFLEGRIGFLDIAATVERTLERIPPAQLDSLEDVYNLDSSRPRDGGRTHRRLPRLARRPNDGYPMNHLFSFLQGGVLYVGVFLVVLTVLVFVHELGHYLIARRNGVKIEVFSIGFGPELFGWWDRAGTRWKFSAIPLGGYVKMFGDSDASFRPAGADVGQLTAAEREVSFHCKRLGQRAAIVAAGPFANFVFAIVVLALLFMTYGQPFTPAEVGPGDAGQRRRGGGIRAGDDDRQHRRAARSSASRTCSRSCGSIPACRWRWSSSRDGQLVDLRVTPTRVEENDRLGRREIGQLGIRGGGAKIRPAATRPARSVRAVGETWNLSVTTLQAMWQMIVGTRGSEELGGPLRIAQLSGEVAQGGVVPLLWFMAVLSINLGLINLFPVPVLDGGHLLFYAAEAIRGRPLGQRAQEYGFRIGLALVLTLMVFATWNDLVHTRARRFCEALRDLTRGSLQSSASCRGGGFWGRIAQVSLAGGACRQLGRRERTVVGTGAAATGAQARPAAARAGTIADVRIEGIQRIEPETVRSYLLLQPGDAWDVERVDRSLKALFATGLFADVKLIREGNTLVVRVVENPIINRIAFEGNSKIADKDLNAEVQARARVVYTRTRVQNDVRRILELYRRQGRFAATVEPKIIQLPENRVDVVFEINEGPSTGIRGDQFRRQPQVRRLDAARRRRDQGKPLVSVLVDIGHLRSRPVAYDRELLRKFYLSEGYADFRVVSAVAELTPGPRWLHSSPSRSMKASATASARSTSTSR